MREEVKIIGKAELWHSRNRRLLQHLRVKNLVVDSGLSLLAAILSAAGATKPSHMAIGASNAVTLANMTALQGTEHERVALSESRVDQSITYSATFGAGILSGVQVGEFGIFNGSPSGTMLARFIVSTFSLGAADTVDVSWTITLV